MTLANYVKLVTDAEKRLRVKEGTFRLEDRMITDPKTAKPKIVTAAAMDVYEEDGTPVTKTFSTLADKLATSLKAMHDNGDLYKYTIGITRTGLGFTTEYRVRLI